MKLVPNPDFEKGEFELGYIGQPGAILPPPMRFWMKDSLKVMALMRENNWSEIEKLAIPSHIPAP